MKPTDYYDRLAEIELYPKTLEERIQDDAGIFWEETPTLVANNKIVCIIGGQPGAGKSHLKDALLDRFSGNILFISMDDYRKAHPLFEKICKEQGENYAKYTQNYAVKIANTLLDKAIERRLNIAYESTLRSFNRVSTLIDKLKTEQYECSVTVVACPAKDSYIATKKRMDEAIAAGKPPRGVATDDHDVIVKVLVENVQKLCNNFKDILISIQTRDGIELWNNQDDKYKDISPSKVLRDELKYSDYLDYKRTLKSNKSKDEEMEL